MNDRNELRLMRAGIAASIITAVGASICCIGPIAAAMFGLTGLATMSRYEPLRPYLAGVTMIVLGGACYMAYRKRPADECAPDSVCATQGVDRMQRFNRTAVWIAALIALVVLTFPTWSNWVLG